MKSLRCSALALALVLPLAGCGTFLDAIGIAKMGGDQAQQLRPYGGVRLDAALIADRELLFVLDLPFSLAFDTVLLPVTVIYTLAKD